MSALIQSAYQAVVSSLVAILNDIQGVWLEALIVAAALHFYYLANSKSGLFRIINRHEGAKHTTKNARAVSKGCASQKGLGIFEGRFGVHDKSREAQKVQKLVAALLSQGSRYAADALVQYEEIVKSRCVNLRDQIPDDQNARSMYVALVGCMVSGAAKPSPASEFAQSTFCGLSRLFADMRAFGFLRTLEFYASVQKILVNHKLFRDALWLHDVMIDDGIKPNVNMYIGFMNVAISCNQPSRAVFFFEESSKLGPPAMRTYMTILRVHSQNKDWKRALELLDRMEKLGTHPDSLILNNILGLCISMGQVAVAERVLHRWKDFIDVISCNILLKGCTQQADLTKAEKVFDSMGSDLPAPNIITFNTVMDCAVRALQAYTNSTAKHSCAVGADSKDTFEKSPCAACAAGISSHSFSMIARRPWFLLDRLLQLGLQPDRYTCSTLIKGMHLAGCSVSDIDRAVELLRSIGPAALQSTASSRSTSQVSNDRLLEVLFNTLLDACITAHDLDRMVQIFKMMQDFQVSVSAVTFGTLIKAFGQAGRLSRCKEVWNEMQQAGIHPTIVTYGCYIDACIRNDDLAAAEDVFQSMVANRVRPNAVVYNSMIRGFAQAKQVDKALEYFSLMQDAGIQSPSITLNSVFSQAAQPNSKIAAAKNRKIAAPMACGSRMKACS